MATRNYEGKKFDNNDIDKIVDALTIEEALQININNKPFTVSMRTPGNDVELVRGLLHAEGVINNIDLIPEVSLKKENEKGIVTIVNVNIPEKELGEGYSNSRSLLSVSSCGICGKTELGDLAFIGKTIDGYYDNCVIVTKETANALHKVQTILEKKGLSLKIFDAYRPQQSVNHFGKWVDPNRTSDNADRLRAHSGEAENWDIGMQLEYFPRSIRAFSARVYAFAPFVSLGAHFTSSSPKGSSCITILPFPKLRKNSTNKIKEYNFVRHRIHAQSLKK